FAGKNLETDVIDFEFEFVELVVIIDNTLSQRRPSFDQGARRVGNGYFGHMADQQQLLLEKAQFLFVVLICVFPFRHDEGPNNNKQSLQICYYSMNFRRDERQNNLDNDQGDNDPFQDLHTPAYELVRNLLVDTFQRFELPQNAGIPLGEVKPFRRQAVDASKILIAQELQNVVDAFE